MTADREVLREAVLTALEPWCTETTYLRATETYDISWVIDGERAANAIVDAVLAAEDGRTVIEWGARCTNNRCAASGKIYHRHTSREKTEHSIRQAENGHFGLVCRRRWVGDWERVSDEIDRKAGAR